MSGKPPRTLYSTGTIGTAGEFAIGAVGIGTAIASVAVVMASSCVAGMDGTDCGIRLFPSAPSKMRPKSQSLFVPSGICDESKAPPEKISHNSYKLSSTTAVI